MALIAEKIAITGMTEILKKLISLSEQEIIRIWNVKKEFKNLKETFPMLLAVLKDADKRQEKEELIRLWLKRLKDVAYEVDDVLDEFSFEAMQMKIQNSKMEKVRDFFSHKNSTNFRSSMARKIEDINKKMYKIGKDMEMFKFTSEDVHDHFKNDPNRKTFPRIGNMQIFGREKEKSMLIDMLIGSSINEECVSVIPILGIGGLGKTTLAQIVYNNESVVAHFDKRIWVCVSFTFEISWLIEGMVQSLTGVNPQLSNTEALQNKLDENLRGQKFLLVLDDVWNLDHKKWEDLKALLAIGAKGSNIIVTTRDERVASIMRTLPQPLHLKGLSEDDSWSLFKIRAFAIGGAEVNPIKEKIGVELVEKCKGVPLAIKSLGALMHSKMSDREWWFVQYSEIWKSEANNGISAVLKLSYHNLPPPLKYCFTYCSIFPKDYRFEKKTLIQLWMAEGLLQSSSSDDKLMEDVGEEYFKSLVWVSFLQDVERDKFGEEVACKMHDLVHDLAQSIIGNECKIVEDFGNVDKPKVEETRYLSVVGHYKMPTPEEFNMEKVRAYLYLGRYNYFPDHIHISAKTFTNFRKLRVLDLNHAGIESLPSSIGELKQLRYLDLSRNQFTTFPESITYLYNLQTLKMLFTSFAQILPKGITKMINLRHLEVDCQLRFPKGIGQLTNLQTLSYFRGAKDIEKAAFAGIEELGDLRQLGGTLELDYLNWRMTENATAANLKEKPRLRKLRLTFRHESYNELLESLQPHPTLICLKINGFGGTKPPTWMDGTSHLSFLQHLQLVDCPNIKSLSLVGLLSLRWLRIYQCQNLSTVLAKELPSLEDIELFNCRDLMYLGVPENDGMPELINLKTLKITVCNILATQPHGFFSLLTSLNTLEINNCSIQRTPPDSITNLSSSLRHLNIEELPRLTIELPESFGNLSLLQELHIVNYKGCFAFPDSFGNLSSLQKLSIRSVNFAALPGSFGNLLKLQELEIVYSESLATLPESFGNLLSLQELTIGYCYSLVALPDSFGNLLNLQELTIDQCSSLVALPDSFGNLLKLQKLSIEDCKSLAALPESFGNLLELQQLTIEGCESLAALPESFGDLLELQELAIGESFGCLAELPEKNLLKLQKLSIVRCRSLAALPESFGNFLQLQHLKIGSCGSLVALPQSFGNLLNLQHLTITDCGRLEVLPNNFGKLSSLEMLYVNNCALTALSESLGALSSLKKLGILRCPNLVSLAGELICGLTSLKELQIESCWSMMSFPDGMQDLVSLRKLHIKGLENLEALPDGLTNLSSLQELLIEDCPSLMSLPDCFERLTSLEILDIHLENLEALPEGLAKLPSLTFLSLNGCKNLKSLPEGIQNLTSLWSLSMIDCPQLRKRYRQTKFSGWPGIISHIPDIVTTDISESESE